ncbi:MAG: hypothetical protein R3F05_00200 [Planctomycetota bacterium]
MGNPHLDRRQLLGLGSAVLLASLLPPLGAHADESYEQTEARLKAAGVDAGLRARIHTAIERASALLVRMQGEGGMWCEDVRRAPQTIRGDTGRQAERLYVAAGACFAALALAHGRTEAGLAGARRAHRALLARYQDVVAEQVYVAGPFLLVADVLAARDGAQALADRLASRQWRKGGVWSYGATPGPNLSTSQFGMLGLWAAERMKLDVEEEPLKAHLIHLMASQLADGAWPYGGSGPALIGTYPNGAAMGLANLLLSGGMLHTRGAVPDEELEIVRLQRLDGLSALRRYAPLVIRGHALQQPFPAWRFYDLFALEKACVFAGVEKLGSFAWYVEGARRLVELQTPDGAWSGRGYTKDLEAATRFRLDEGLDPELVQVFDTAVGLLFLLRLSEGYQPPPITPPSTQPPTTGPTASPGPVMALREIRDLGQQLDEATTSNDQAIQILNRLHDRYDEGRDDEHRDVERVAIEGVLIRALRLRRVDAAPRRNLRERVNIHAARLLATVSRRVLASVLRAIEDMTGTRTRFRVGPGLIEALLDVVVAFADDATARQLVEWSVVTTLDDASQVRARSALCALRELGSQPPDTRRAMTRKLLDGYRPFERLAANPANRVSAQVWRILEPEVVYACLCLLRGSTGGDEPTRPDGSRIATLDDVRAALGE